MGKSAQSWACHSCHRSDVSRGVRKSKGRCVLCLEIGLLSSLPQRERACGQLRTRMEIHVEKLNKLMLGALADVNKEEMHEETNKEYYARASAGLAVAGAPTPPAS
eukprot:12739161-Alexandrium_andersonii.AAC.1